MKEVFFLPPHLTTPFFLKNNLVFFHAVIRPPPITVPMRLFAAALLPPDFTSSLFGVPFGRGRTQQPPSFFR